ncbi:bifunctional folylpolyglutamate synthase/dihydrofolate synthase [Thermoclostridium stercorarium subsp. thermolacticum DSM 2910]|jgi:dihydrofolate synthase/folylpolyglutamate synthase|uniref:tetrahydrofolate synthase n=2 Tax=Thermoclostridium stercorarium TaxID=1510 RepID=A0A1B1YIP9_THEST|nr:folylpolyglutamate synthase/dihydrofolate synthase family protein [Thermoclostridium stercorarium]ANW98102.1 bifunctional folylpolyglutamate synthase/dihydrofolate synthase [Thermoclostridium stercorarium subsp. thermolacticum DSM 2910]ANX00645.1 bifunctional folylpolyglutamate synthase/dihydrofolate synthase [Thermoclostridium stercorarium subsp. leptospartum DSM 9219]UZQ86257.1 bifunctional folylpolyglutamate synthase/dihydrofolate synthase [Thermoclostridium stercorarium]
MNYENAIEYIESLEGLGSRSGLKRIKALTERLGNPQEHLKFIHVAGTNGKGSTSAFISSILSCAGYSTGLYISPHLQRYNERISINGQEISDEELFKYTWRIKNVIDEMVKEGLEHPTVFEVITAMAFLYFYEKGCDAVVLEVGLGGRLDATNVISDSLVSVITKISLDHTEILGNTVAEIAYEKAGIIKQNGRVVTYPQEKAALDVIESVCRQRNAELYCADPGEFEKAELSPGLLHLVHPRYGNIETSIVGVHQVYNASVALKTVEVLRQAGFKIEDGDVVKGFKTASWPGRFELLARNPDFYIDGGHNPDGVRSFVETYKKIYPDRKATIIFGVMKDKDYDAMLRELSAISKRFIAVIPDSPRALDAGSLVKVMSKYCKNVEFSDTIEAAVEKALSDATGEDVIAALGSLYYIGQVRGKFQISAQK